MINSVHTPLTDVKPTTFASYGVADGEIDVDPDTTFNHVDPVETLDSISHKRRTLAGPVISSQSSLTADNLSKRWGIGKKQAADTLKVTTQKGVRNITASLSRRFKTQR